MNMAQPSQKCKEILRDIYDSEELKIDSNRCKAIAKTIEMLCTTENSAFNDMYGEVASDIEKKKSEPTTKKKKQPQALYLYQVERLPVLLKKLGKEERGSINDSILWQVSHIIRVTGPVYILRINPLVCRYHAKNHLHYNYTIYSYMCTTI